MNKLLVKVVAVFAVSVGWIPLALAQQAQDKAAAVEFFACEWQDGKGMADLEKVGQKFSKWADKNDSSYSAWILTPQFHTNVGFDVGWLGAWPDGNAFGKAQDAWMAGGRELAADFGKVIDCSASHELATSVVIRAPKNPPGNGVVMFSECTMAEGKSPADAVPAHRKAGAAMTDMGSNASAWVFYPGLGSGDIDFDYWHVVAFQNYTDMGAAVELYVNGGGWKKIMTVMAPVSRCGSPSVFDVRLVRTGATN